MNYTRCQKLNHGKCYSRGFCCVVAAVLSDVSNKIGNEGVENSTPSTWLVRITVMHCFETWQSPPGDTAPKAPLWLSGHRIRCDKFKYGARWPYMIWRCITEYSEQFGICGLRCGRRADMTNLIVAFWTFENVSKSLSLARNWTPAVQPPALNVMRRLGSRTANVAIPQFA